MNNDLNKISKVGLGTFPFSGIFSKVDNEVTVAKYATVQNIKNE